MTKELIPQTISTKDKQIFYQSINSIWNKRPRLLSLTFLVMDKVRPNCKALTVPIAFFTMKRTNTAKSNI